MIAVAEVRVCEELILLGIQNEISVLLRSFRWSKWKINIQKFVRMYSCELHWVARDQFLFVDT